MVDREDYRTRKEYRWAPARSTFMAILAAPLIFTSLIAASSAPAATVGVSLTSQPIEGSVHFAATGEVGSTGVLTAFVTPAGTQSCPGTMSEAEMAGFGKPHSVGGSFSEGFEAWIVQPGPILACAYDESFTDNTEGRSSLSVNIESTPDITCNIQTRVCIHTTIITIEGVTIKETCEGEAFWGSCHKEEIEALTTSPPIQPKTVSSRRATRAQASALNAAFREYQRAGRYRRDLGKLDMLRDIKVTNNGWAVASLAARHPKRHEQPGNKMIFRVVNGHWRALEWGTAPSLAGMPSAVRHALFPDS